ncbi:hypothetical protein Taro_042651 [Colocasia esculenta]|uniref:Protein GAMETE EXPRESSED 1 n=1 Tax=Colocasia esculenta TaxID=4460 RepID=A0A843WZZ6_COLES|nr:hypothetical protein [Colocasia esculenta]
MGNYIIFVIFILVIPDHCTCLFNWLSSSESYSDHDAPSAAKPVMGDKDAPFSVESFDNYKGKKLVEETRMKQLSLNSCWQEAYRNLFASCSEIIANEEKHSRLAWQLSNCFIRDSGRPSIPSCAAKSMMKDCRKKLNDFEHEIYLQFFIQTNSICHQLQAEAFKRDTERLVNDLKRSAQVAEEKLKSMQGKSEQLLRSSNEIHDSLATLDLRTQKVVQASSNIENQINDMLKQSLIIYEQADGIRASQTELLQGQTEMKDKLESSMSALQESYENLGDGMEKLRQETVEIEKEINEVGHVMASKMQNLQNTADDIGHVTSISLDKQKELVNGQTTALQELEFLKKLQSDALEESRTSLENLAKSGHKQQADLLQRQEQIQQAHDRLFQSSQTILAAQEEFEVKQASIFSALDKLFTLHNAILLESRLIKSFFFYSCVVLLLYMLTSTKQTFNLGLCITFILEFAIVRFVGDDLHQQTWITSKISLARASFLVAAALQILHSIFTYRQEPHIGIVLLIDYEVLNHKMLQRLIEKMEVIEQNTGKDLLSWSTDSGFSGYSWIDEELPEDVNSCDDSDYVLPEEVAENSICTTSSAKRYELRPRRCQR